MKLTVVVGNPNPNSRTLMIAEALAAAIEARLDVERGMSIDLASVAGRLFNWPDPGVAELNEVVAESDIAIVATPTYKASFTGLLKAFLDRYANLALTGVVAVPVMTGGGQTHALAPDMQLRPVLVELGANVPTASLYFEMAQLKEMDQVIAGWMERNGDVLAACATGLCRASSGSLGES